MASVNDPTGDRFASTVEYSTSGDQISRADHEVTEFPRGRVAPPPAEDEKGKKGKPERVDRPMDSQVVADLQGTRMAEAGHPAVIKPERKPQHWVRRIVILTIVAAIIGAALYWGVPAIHWAMITTSTDDAFVSGHTTYVSTRVDGLVTEVMVEENDRVEAGTILVRLDREPFVIALQQSEASLVQARANLDLAKAQVRAQLATARGAFFSRRTQQEQLSRQIRSLEAQVASLRSRQSSQHLAELDQRRLNALTTRGSATQSELDQRNNTLDMANQAVTEAWTDIQETRAALGLSPDYEHPQEVPKDLLERQSSIENAVSSISSSLAQIGIPFNARDIKPGEAFEQIINMDTSEGLENAFGHVVDQAPAVQVAQAAVVKATSDLANSKLNLSWTEIRAEVAGYVQDRSASPGNRVEPGTSLLSIRPDYVWIEANYKETQIHHIKIGMPVDFYVDAYPGKMFKGRVSAFRAGTGLSKSLLPPENATGNYIKVTQRLPVRIELIEPNPVDTPLFIGLSVVPYVKHEEAAIGPDSGKRLHPENSYRQHPDAGGGPAGRQLQNRVEADAKKVGDAPSSEGERP